MTHSYKYTTTIFVAVTINNNNTLHIGIGNCCSELNKRAELEELLYSQKLDILLGTDSNLDDSIFDSEVFPANHSTYSFRIFAISTGKE